MAKDCCFYVYKDEESKDRIGVLCVSCAVNEESTWFWPGSVRGYKADARFVCKKCGDIIHESEFDNPENSENPA